MATIISVVAILAASRGGRRSRGSLPPPHSAPSTSTPSRETSPATAPSIAIRWSPRASMRPPRSRVGHAAHREAVRRRARCARRARAARRRPPRSGRSPSRAAPPRRGGRCRRARATASEREERQLVDEQRHLRRRRPSSRRARRGGTSRSPTGSPPMRRRLKTVTRAPIRSSTSRRPVRRGLRLTPWTVSSEPGSSVAATTNGAAEEKSPGTSTSPSGEPLGRPDA